MRLESFFWLEFKSLQDFSLKSIINNLSVKCNSKVDLYTLRLKSSFVHNISSVYLWIWWKKTYIRYKNSSLASSAIRRQFHRSLTLILYKLTSLSLVCTNTVISLQDSKYLKNNFWHAYGRMKLNKIYL